MEIKSVFKKLKVSLFITIAKGMRIRSGFCGRSSMSLFGSMSLVLWRRRRRKVGHWTEIDYNKFYVYSWLCYCSPEEYEASYSERKLMIAK